METRPPFRSARADAFVSWSLRYGLLLWLLAVALGVPAAYRTASLYLHLRTDFEELLPRKAPSVVAIDELRTRMPGLQHLGVIVDAGGAANLPAAERLVDDLAARVRTYSPELVRSVRTGVGAERAFLEKNAPLYVSLDDLREVRRRVEARRDYDVAEQLGTRLDDEPPPSIDTSDIEEHYRDSDRGTPRFEHDRFSSSTLGTTLLVIEVGGYATGEAKNAALMKRVQQDVAALGGPAAYAPGMRVGYASDVATSVEETEALMSDLSVASILVIVGVLAAIALYFRWWRSMIALFAPLLLATVFSFALASLPPFGVTELNSNTAFLGSIIVGNGINFGIILLARYLEARREGTGVRGALSIAVSGARVGTLTAALAAGASYAALALTQFRGFRQFGFIGGIGMVMCWSVTFLLMPSLLAWLERSPDAAPKPRRARAGTGPMTALARLVVRYPAPIVAVAAALTVAALVRASAVGEKDLEYDFSRLRRADTWTNGEGYWGHKMDELLGQYLTPMVVLADTPQQAMTYAATLRRAATSPELSNVITSIRAASDVVPTDQPAKIREIEALRNDLTPRIRASLSPAQRDTIDRYLGKGPLHPITAADVPATFTTGMREHDGSIDRVVVIFPKASVALWTGPSLVAFVRELRELVTTETPGVRPGRVAGSLALSADIISSIQRDGPLASGAALLGVVVVVLALFRRRSTGAYVIGSLLVGVLWLLAATAFFGIKINFANFIAFPITFGIGVDYAVNIMGRYEQDGRVDVTSAVQATGGAVALCSCTTILGYTSLLVAQNRALSLFGLIAVLGEITCLVAALIVLPAALLLLGRVGWRSTDVPTARPSTRGA